MKGASFGYRSVFEMYRRRFETHLGQDSLDNSEKRQKTQSISDSDPVLMCAILDWYRKFEIVDNSCRDPEQLAIGGYADYVECPGAYYINFKDGYQSFVQTATKLLPDGSLRVRSPVSKITWKHEQNKTKVVTLETSGGDVLTCDHVIVTPSVGVLKEFSFEPPLPDFKYEALNCFGFDVIDKIFLVWDDGPFWSEETLGFQFLWTHYDDSFFKEHGQYLRGIYGFEKVNRRPNVLLGWIGGDDAIEMEKVPDDEVLHGCFHLLKRFIKQLSPSEVRAPSRIIRSAWASDRFIRGAYSHRLLAFDEAEDPVGKLQEPLYYYNNETEKIRVSSSIATESQEINQQVQGKEKSCPLVLFAGEGTDRTYFSTVHGAFRSGQREAQRLIDFWTSDISN
ncbi:hypothetical protein BIW11_14357 [Tropilaelaps mercedesae]|uniref:Amine oxidase domain-containing protein n=1 Tax=Tropilaelaps mercedesae TaxID=418985 RepID=A0A1V9WXZ7_9ACAR|nr:hypothetical protein BIW11_14357 [Tropilaelaps mercedesae]